MCVQYVRRARIDKRGPGRALIARGDILAFSIASPSCEHNVFLSRSNFYLKRENFDESEISRLI